MSEPNLPSNMGDNDTVKAWIDRIQAMPHSNGNGLPAGSKPVTNMDRFQDLVSNVLFDRRRLMSLFLDPRRSIELECGWPETIQIDPEACRDLYERDPIANRAVNVWPNESWQVQPTVYESEDPDKTTPFEDAWDGLSMTLRGGSNYQDEADSCVWEYLWRADKLSGIGRFGIILLGIDDGQPLEVPAPGAPPDGFNPDLSGVTAPSTLGVTGHPILPGTEGYQLVPTAVQPNPRMGPPSQYEQASPYGDLSEQVPAEETARRKALQQPRKGKGPSEKQGNVASLGSPYAEAAEEGVEAPDQLESPVGQLGAVTKDIYGSPMGGPSLPPLQNPLSSQMGTDAQYTGIQFTPGLAQDQWASSMRNWPTYTDAEATGKSGGGQGKQSSGKATPDKAAPARRLLFMRVFDETLVQVVQYEADMRNPRFGQPVMYRVTLNDPRMPHTGVGLPLNTVRVHWSRIVHLADNLLSSEIFGLPRLQVIWNRLLDLRKLYGGSAEGYWRSGCMTGISLETNPQLGGDVAVNKAALADEMENYFNGLQRYIALMGMTAKTLGPQVVDPTSQINVQVEAVCIALEMPIRVFKGSERGELASSQDDANWNGRVKHRQHTYLTPRVIVPLVDRLIQLGILPPPGSKGKARVQNLLRTNQLLVDMGKEPRFIVKKMPNGRPGWIVVNKGTGRTTVVTPAGYSVEWPDVEANSDQEKAQIALTKTQAVVAYTASQASTQMPPSVFYTQIMGMDEEEVSEMLDAGEEWSAEHPPPAPMGGGFGGGAGGFGGAGEGGEQEGEDQGQQGQEEQQQGQEEQGGGGEVET
jgi:hypothetical protein